MSSANRQDFALLFNCYSFSFFFSLFSFITMAWSSTGASWVVLVVKNLTANTGDISVDSILQSGRSPGGKIGNPLQCSCLRNRMDRVDLRAIVHGVVKSWTLLKNLILNKVQYIYWPLLNIFIQYSILNKVQLNKVPTWYWINWVISDILPCSKSQGKENV